MNKAKGKPYVSELTEDIAKLTRSLKNKQAKLIKADKEFQKSKGPEPTSLTPDWVEVVKDLVDKTDVIIEGIKTTIPFEKAVLHDPEFCRGVYTTNFVGELLGGGRRELIQEKA